jgi:hypothetical protein
VAVNEAMVTTLIATDTRSGEELSEVVVSAPEEATATVAAAHKPSPGQLSLLDSALDPEADARTRTGDPFITSEVLYQLSYVGGAGRV